MGLQESGILHARLKFVFQVGPMLDEFQGDEKCMPGQIILFTGVEFTPMDENSEAQFDSRLFVDENEEMEERKNDYGKQSVESASKEDGSQGKEVREHEIRVAAEREMNT